MIPPDFIDEVLARTDIVEIIDPRVSLKKKGQNYSGLCPFHNEKTPSFSVSQDKQFYYCFGCQASGSALKFLMEFDRMEFPETGKLDQIFAGYHPLAVDLLKKMLAFDPRQRLTVQQALEHPYVHFFSSSSFFA